MAANAKRDMANRTIEVNRQELLETLKKNREKHVKDYEEAMAGYKDALLDKIESSYEEAKAKLEKKYKQLKLKTAELDDNEIKDQSDYITLVDSFVVNMEVPRSYVEEYDQAIDIATWDVNDTLELSSSEFACFVRDKWSWKSDFEVSTAFYKSVRKA